MGQHGREVKGAGIAPKPSMPICAHTGTQVDSKKKEYVAEFSLRLSETKNSCPPTRSDTCARIIQNK